MEWQHAPAQLADSPACFMTLTWIGFMTLTWIGTAREAVPASHMALSHWQVSHDAAGYPLRCCDRIAACVSSSG